MEKKIKCPKCSVFINRWMRKLTHPSGATLDVCDRCGGMWLDKEEVMLLSKNSAQKTSKKVKRNGKQNKK